MLQRFTHALFLFTVSILFSFNTVASKISLLENTSFVRTKGKPKIETVQFNYQEGEQFQLTVFNGGENKQYCRISSAVITLNGTTVFSQSDFNQQVFMLTADVELQQENTLSVKLASKPGCGIELNVSGDELSLPLAITSAPATQTISGELYQYAVTTNIPLDWDNTAITLINAPEGMSVTNNILSWTPSASQVSQHSVSFQVIDETHGIAEQSFELNVISANQAPIVNDRLVNATEDNNLIIDLTAIDPNNDVITFEILSEPEHGTIQQNNSQITFIPVDNFFGQDSFQYSANDGEFTSNIATVTIDIAGDNDAPEILSEPLLSVLENNLYVYLVETIDVDGDPISFTLLQNPVGMTIDSTTGKLSWLPSNAQLGEHGVTIELADPQGASVVQSYILQVINVNDAPSINSSPVTLSNEDEVYSYNVVATDPDVDDTLTFGLDIVPAGMMIDSVSGLISWTPSNSQVGSHSVTLSVIDAGGLTASQNFTLVVNNVNDAPQITSSPILDILEDEQYQYQVVVSDEDIADTFTIELTNAPVGMSISSDGLVQWLPEQKDVGTVEVSVKVQDMAGLFDSQTYNVAISNVNDTPVFSAIDTQTIEVFNGLIIELSATDEDSDTLSYSVINAPEGVTVDAISGIFNWTPLVTQVGQHTVEVGVSDGIELVSTEFTVIVESPLYANPEFNDDVQLVGFVGENFSHTIDVTAEVAVELRLLSAPEGLTLDVSSDILSWMPTIAGKYTVEVAAHLTEEIVTIKVYQITILEKASNHEGSDFWLTFSNNLQQSSAKLFLYISSSVDTSGVVEVPLQNRNFSFEVLANQVTVVELPSDLMSPIPYYETIIDNGIHVTSENDITVYALNTYAQSTDGFLVLPTESLGIEHRAMTYGSDQISVVATQDNTQVDIIFSEDTEIELGTKYSKGETLSVNLNKGQTFNALKWAAANNGLAGSSINSNLPIAVFTGARCTFVPVTVSACDHLVEQLQDVKYWGQTYYSVPLANRFYGDLFQVTAAFDDTRVSINGEYLLTLNNGEWLTDILETASVITATHPIQVAQFSQGADIDKNIKYQKGYSVDYGDPFMMILTPVSQNISSYIFSTTDLDIVDNFVNVVIEQGALSTLRIDNQPVDTSIFSAIQNTSLYGGQLTVLEGTHTLTAETTFSASIYGFGDYYNSYGYQGGGSLGRYSIDTQITLVDIPVSMPVGQELCFVMQIGNETSPLQKARFDVYSQNSAKTLYHHYSNSLGQAEHCHYGLREGLESIIIRSGEVSTSINVNWLAPQGNGNQSPVIVNTPYPSAQSNKPYRYELIAIDPDPTQPIAFNLLDGPAAMALNGSIITWTPTSSDIGLHSVTVQAMDSNGNSSALTFELKVYLGNQPPELMTAPQDKVVYIGRNYTETFKFTDPDDRDTYCQLTSPLFGANNNKVAISQQYCSLLSSVNLTEEHLGTHLVTIKLWDQAGGEASYSYTVEVRENHLPDVVSEPAQFAKVGEPYLSSLVMSDPDGDTLSYKIVLVKNEGNQYITSPLSIDELSGEITWDSLPDENDVGTYIVSIWVYDVVDVLHYEYPLTISLPDEPLVAHLDISPKFINIGESVNITASATGGVGNVHYNVSVNGTEMTLDDNHSVVVSDTNESGIYDITANVTDDAGSNYQFTDYFVVRVDAGDGDGTTPDNGDGGTTDPTDPDDGGSTDPTDPGTGGISDPDYPEVEFININDNDQVFSSTDVEIKVSDANLVEWRLSLADEHGEILLASGRNNIEGIVGNIDPTQLVNGLYELLLYATDINGQSATRKVSLLIDGKLKVGNFSYTVEEFSVPMAGFPISVSRTYDSRRKHQLGDFGYGWTLNDKLIDLDLSRKLGLSWSMIEKTKYMGSVPVPVYCAQSNGDILATVTLPNDDVETFKVKATPECTDFFPTIEVHLEFEAVGDTTSSLALKNNTQVRLVNGNLVILGNDAVFNAEDFILTSREGAEFHINSGDGVSLIKNPNGQTLTFDDNGIYHSSGKSITYNRNADGVISSIKRPESRTSFYIDHNFNYDGANRLTRRAIQNNLEEELYGYDYRNTLIKIKDEAGRTKVFNIYDDDGRLIAQEDSEGNRTSFNHNIEGKQSSITDRNGNITFHYYDDRGNIISTVDALGNITSFTYDDNDNVLTITDPLGNVVTQTYSEKSDVLSRTDAEGNSISYTYNVRGQELTITDANGNVYNNAYDSVGNMLSITDPLDNTAGSNINAEGLVELTQDMLGNQTLYEYDSLGNKIKETDVRGSITTYVYDFSNRVSQSAHTRTKGDGSTVSDITNFSYTQAGNVALRSDNLGSIETNTYDDFGYLIQQTLNDVSTIYTRDVYGRVLTETVAGTNGGLVTTFTYDPEGNKLTEIDANGNTTQFTYDALNRLVKTTYADASYTTSEYDAAGRVIGEVNENGHKMTFTYDKAGRRTSQIDALGNVSAFEYDAASNLTKQTDALGRVIVNQYDVLDNRIEVTYADSTTTASTYDAMGRNTEKTDQASQQIRYEYNALGQLITVTDTQGNITAYQYDEAGNKTAQIDAKGNTTRWEYDARGQVLARVLPMGQREIFSYNNSGDMKSHVDFNGKTTSYIYASPHRLLKTTYADASTEEFTYDNNGNRLSAQYSLTGTWVYEYDSRNRLTKETQPSGDVLTYSYDAVGNKTQSVVTYANGDVRTETSTYDELNRLKTFTDNDNNITTYAYDAVGNRGSVTHSNSNITAYVFDALNRLTQLQDKKVDGTIYQQFDYTLDATGRRTQISELNGRISDYSYDELYRLTDEIITDGINGNYTANYVFDNAGNRTQSIIDGVTTAYTYDNNDRLLQAGGEVYTYDDAGNTLSTTIDSDITTYTYDARQKLTAADITKSGITTNASYQYNIDGIRTEKVENGIVTNYLVDSNRDYAQVIAETDSSDNVNVEYVFGDDLLSQKRGAEVGNYHYDGLGSTRVLTDSMGTVTDEYFYDAFGETLATTGVRENDYLFTGEQYDAGLDNYYLRARYYNQGVGRFTQQDEWMGNNSDPITLHKYLYANTDPVSYVDPSGKFSMGSVMSAVNIAGSLAIVSYTTYQIGQSLTAGDNGEGGYNDLQVGWMVIAGMSPAAAKVRDLINAKLDERNDNSVVTLYRAVEDGELASLYSLNKFSLGRSAFPKQFFHSAHEAILYANTSFTKKQANNSGSALHLVNATISKRLYNNLDHTAFEPSIGSIVTVNNLMLSAFNFDMKRNGGWRYLSTF